MIPAKAALERLRQGNGRYVEGAPSATTARQDVSLDGQAPFAAILGCADSRVPVEHIFDQEVGRLFVVRVAGNVAEATSLGSIEYAVSVLETRLVVVMGHTHCGAVQAAVTNASLEGGPEYSNLRAVTTPIREALQPLLAARNGENLASFLPRAVEANVSATARQLRSRSPLLDDAAARGGVQIIGAVYDLATGVVTFLQDA